MVHFMIKFTTLELEIESNLKQRIEFVCEFCHVTPLSMGVSKESSRLI